MMMTQRKCVAAHTQRLMSGLLISDIVQVTDSKCDRQLTIQGKRSAKGAVMAMQW